MAKPELALYWAETCGGCDAALPGRMPLEVVIKDSRGNILSTPGRNLT